MKMNERRWYLCIKRSSTDINTIRYENGEVKYFYTREGAEKAQKRIQAAFVEDVDIIIKEQVAVYIDVREDGRYE